VRVLVDILAGASAGGINAIFLAEAIAGGRSLDPLTDLWLETADVDRLLDPEVSRMSRFAKAAAVPLAWAWSSRRGDLEQTVEAEHREEIRAKLANFVRARWFAPPFSGAGFTRLLLGAFDAMAAGPEGPPLLPDYQPLDLFVTVTDFTAIPSGSAQLSRRGDRAGASADPLLPQGGPGPLADAAELTFAARATASFPGAFPPFQVARARLGAGRARAGLAGPGRLPRRRPAPPVRARQGGDGGADRRLGARQRAVPAGDPALQSRPARREVDRRFVYIDPKPGVRSVRLGGGGQGEAPGFFATIFGALSDIPREQPIRDNLEAIEQRSATDPAARRIVEAMRPEVEAAIERARSARPSSSAGPTPKRLAGWRAKAQSVAAREAGYAYAAYGQLKLASVAEEVAERLFELGGGGDRGRHEQVRQAIWNEIRGRGLAGRTR
jgi:patatin-related protein